MQRLNARNLSSKDPRLGPGSLWAPLPIPACRALTYAGQIKASQLLFAMVLHASGNSPYVFPSRETLSKYSGVGKNSITQALAVLERFGFIRIDEIKQGPTYRNRYELLRACWHWDEFNEVASRYKVPKGHCTKCGNWIYSASWYYENRRSGLATIRTRVHFNCGGVVKNLNRNQMLITRQQEEAAGMPLYMVGQVCDLEIPE